MVYIATPEQTKTSSTSFRMVFRARACQASARGYVDFYLPIMAYIRVEGASLEGKETKATGDIAIGKLLFKKHNCGGCHWTDADRGRFGTNLTSL